ncbi:DNA polymerase IV [Petrocella sp. FN5]|uniref:DNA polymerase IV n=1 Tax=Petrocella sp. FN5 TaxID=3032002 RepID=UPI0023DA711E|nr:DNA polymerase IV [Petrocella sp. FN5]MDF1618503.1 DNA polymerase IV [Petrocella sp. FN5]
MCPKTIFHIDMNAFFASCEQARNPELKQVPLIVGGDPETRRGIVLAASYDAKAYGVKTTMLIHEAMRLCPKGKVIAASHDLYVEMSQKVMSIFDDYTPIKQQVSIDEAFLDMTGTEHLFGEPKVAAKRIQDDILKQLDLPCSVGIANNKLLAKMASEYKKPMGITTLFEEGFRERIWPLEVGELYGIGKKTVPKLMAMGIKTIGDLANAKVNILVDAFGYKTGMYMHESANGIGTDVVDGSMEQPKSIGNEMTYSKDILEMALIREEVLLLADRVGYRLRRKMLSGKTVSVKLKYSDFSVMTRSKTIEAPTHHTEIIYETAMALIRQAWTKKPLRLLGVTVSGFEASDYRQVSLFDMEMTTEKAEVDHMLDEIRNKYGYSSIKRATLLDRKPPK